MTTFIEMLNNQWIQSNSLVCVGLDPIPERFPAALGKSETEDSIFNFNRLIIDATYDLACAYKPQAAHYSAIRAEKALEKTIDYIHTTYPGIPVILDAKRGDIGSTAQYYALEAFERYQADAVTVNPYLGGDSLQPFLAYEKKGIIILCHTSNAGAADIQDLLIHDQPLYLHIAKLAVSQWNHSNNVVLVVGATKPTALKQVRTIVGEMPLLVPGIGAQGGDIEETMKAGQNKTGNGLIINATRSILYHDTSLPLAAYAARVREAAIQLKENINAFRQKK